VYAFLDGGFRRADEAVLSIDEAETSTSTSAGAAPMAISARAI
jgi:hypothetical protein